MANQSLCRSRSDWVSQNINTKISQSPCYIHRNGCRLSLGRQFHIITFPQNINELRR
ncbi:unnamed protein product [Arabidopsis lyrata]|uniref:Predicted protein n=1 Tax=Arabidopsis lyrata subsp. lyrata TaxID=81972 RepID=D7KDT5_ARALL|nr:predicted protein [Arabidopsis lyrata subsp. lyrata]CAH8253861.1 unnamed protein product [Arabidopsis lyrata]